MSTRRVWPNPQAVRPVYDVRDRVTVVIPIYGDMERWGLLAEELAMKVNHHQTWSPRVLVSGGMDLSSARNDGADQVDTEWTVFLDADDELSPDYIQRMLEGEGDVRWPSVQRTETGQVLQPDHPVDRLETRNWIVIGAMIRTELAQRVRFREMAMYEDWDFWLRVKDTGADLRPCLSAVYHVTWRSDSRSRAHSAIHQRWYHEVLNSRSEGAGA